MELALTQAPQRASLDPAPRQPHDSGRHAVRPAAGTVTFLFTDVEGSTKLLRRARRRAVRGGAGGASARDPRGVLPADGGVEVDTQGDAFFFAFPTAPRRARRRVRRSPRRSPPARSRCVSDCNGKATPDRGGLRRRRRPLGRSRGCVCSWRSGRPLAGDLRALDHEGYSLIELGEHRLKDIEPVPIFQLGDESFPPLKTISNTNLPAPPASFVGRERRAQKVPSRIEKGARLVTLTGPGGTGKTRLALEAADARARVQGWRLLGRARLAARARAGHRNDRTDLGAKDGLAEHIGEREMLLLLDNLEQVIEAAPELSALLRALPQPHAACHKPGAPAHPGRDRVPGPALAEPRPSPSSASARSSSPATDLRALRAASTRCRSPSSSPPPARRRSRPPRSSSASRTPRPAEGRPRRRSSSADPAGDDRVELRPALAEEQELFARLSVFAGGCTLEAAEEICDADLDTLQSLVEKSLLRFTGRALLDARDDPRVRGRAA